MDRITTTEEQATRGGVPVAPGGYRKLAIEDLWAYWPRIVGYAYLKVRDHDRAEDLAQDTLVRAWTHLDSFQPGTNLSAWLHTIARRLVMDAWRYDQSHRHVSLEVEGNRETPDEDGRGITEGIITRERRQRAFASLSPFQQQTFIQIAHGNVPPKMETCRARAAFWRAYRRLQEKEERDAA